ncbi:MAG TPA: VanZ family protein [Burkholderiales bacterium]|nr:VanZ family protein [Burkholderiales bacterium]
MRGSPLARLALAVYILLVVYASLYPLQGWRSLGLSPFEFLSTPWPRYVAAFDVVADVLGYSVFGALAVLASNPRLRPTPAVLGATLAGLALSIAMEAAQSYLPTRIPSIVDVLSNGAGALIGALLGLAVVPWTRSLHGGRAQFFLPGTLPDLGLALIALWIFMQLNPATPLFGGGDLRHLLTSAPGPARAPEFFVAIETLTTAGYLAAVGLLVSAISVPRAPVRAMAAVLVAAALAVKTLAFAIILRAEHVLAWLTPGAVQGLAAGAVILLLAVSLPRVARLALAAVLLMAATVLVNLAPPNPYVAATLAVWRQGHFLNFNGLTRVVSSLWPFATIGYLIVLSARWRDDALL